MLAPSRRHPRSFVRLPARSGGLARAQRCDAQGNNCRSNGWDQYVDVVRSDEFQHAAVGDGQVRPAHGAGRARARRRAGRARRQVPAAASGVFRAIFSSTIATSVAVASLMWLFLLAARRRRAGQRRLDRRHLPGGQGARACCATRARRWPSVAASSVWASLGFTFILVTAGLQGIPRDLHEAAVVDGAGGHPPVLEHHPADARPDAAVRRSSC